MVSASHAVLGPVGEPEWGDQGTAPVLDGLQGQAPRAARSLWQWWGSAGETGVWTRPRSRGWLAKVTVTFPGSTVPCT